MISRQSNIVGQTGLFDNNKSRSTISYKVIDNNCQFLSHWGIFLLLLIELGNAMKSLFVLK